MGEIIIGLGAALGVFAFRRLLIAQRVSRWRGAMNEHQLKGITVSYRSPLEAEVTGKTKSYRVRMSRYYADKGDHGTRIEIRCPERLLAGVVIQTEGVRTPEQGEAKEIEVGDGAFDGAFYIGGSPALVHALLDQDLRHQLLARLHAFGPIDISAGCVCLDVSNRESLDREVLSQTLAGALHIARLLVARARRDIPARLADNARQDPLPLVRLRNLLVLWREFGDRAITRETLQAACDDPYPEVRLRAALALGRERFDMLFDIAESGSSEDASVASAVQGLGLDLSVERATAILQRALRTGGAESAHACLRRLGRSPEASAIRTLARVLAREDADLAVHAARALAETGAPEAENLLVAAFDRDGEPLVAQAAAEALGRCGTAAAVLPLGEAAERHTDRGLQRAARQAIAEIQSRLSGVEPGQVSLAASETGQLSLADSEAGRVSLVERKDPDDAA